MKKKKKKTRLSYEKYMFSVCVYIYIYNIFQYDLMTKEGHLDVVEVIHSCQIIPKPTLSFSIFTSSPG